MEDVVKGEMFSFPFSPYLLKCLCTGFYDVMVVGALEADPLPFGCYCHIEDDEGWFVGTAIVWAAPMIS